MRLGYGVGFDKGEELNSLEQGFLVFEESCAFLQKERQFKKFELYYLSHSLVQI